MLLTAEDILDRMFNREGNERLLVTPLLSMREQLQPSSLDVRLGTDFAVMRRVQQPEIDLFMQDDERFREELARYIEPLSVPPDGHVVLHPGSFMLGTTLEFVCLPSTIAARLEGKSTWGRLGIQIHSTAGFVDPCYGGHLTFELSNIGQAPVRLYPGVPIAQLCFYEGNASKLTYANKERAAYRKPGALGPGLSNLRSLRTLQKLMVARLEKK